MCGIAGVHRRSEEPLPRLGRLANHLLLGIEKRGPDSTGYLAMHDSGKVQLAKAPVTARKFIERRPRFSDETRSLLLHTRLATRGKVNTLNAHPQISGSVAAVHNGTIYNADDLFTTFGLKRRAQVDSEIIPALIDFVGWTHADKALGLMRGGAATAIVHSDHPREVLLARLRTYPIVWYANDDLVIWASTEHAIVTAWRYAYSTRMPRGEWGRLANWTMLRVNGDLQEYEIPHVEEEPPPKQAPRRAVAAPVATRGSYVSPWPSTYDAWEHEPWMDDVVRDLMRIEGYSLSEAEELVYGTTIDADEDWREELWSDADLEV